MRTRLVVPAAVLAAAALACGGDDPVPRATPSAAPTTASPAPTPTPTPLSKAEWVGKITAICDDVEAEADKIGEPKTAKDYAEAMATLVRIIDEANAEIRTLPPPAADAAALEANFMGPNEKQEETFRAALPELQSAAQSEDTAAAEKAFGDAISTTTPTDAQASFLRQYGLGDCV
ncbi:MAG TPA: hypothetical protein VGX28_16750 [Frankiaceae bacterium]|jgi:hypothetical protein|nr:hypothetical protein [Frankiaceae bacterium]